MQCAVVTSVTINNRSSDAHIPSKGVKSKIQMTNITLRYKFIFLKIKRGAVKTKIATVIARGKKK